ncbi:DUF5060 domain-containing protein [Streptomyces umbrinus]|uniref:DUF5060 domain-containing protein n=1 Tax=Streptomyces umbrinus TaxID=67370 RepID=UPI0033D6D140
MAEETATRWSAYELELHGPGHGNPFTDVAVRAEFTCGERTLTAHGFYDGEAPIASGSCRPCSAGCSRRGGWRVAPPRCPGRTGVRAGAQLAGQRWPARTAGACRGAAALGACPGPADSCTG